MARARASGLDPRQIEYLNALVGRAYAHVYTAETHGGASIVAFFARDFPRSVRHCAVFIGVAFAIFLLAALIGLVATYRDGDAPNALLGPEWSASLQAIAERHAGRKDWLPGEIRPIAASGIMTNNIMVSILAFSSGVLGCVPTLLILFYNGLILGAVTAAVDRHNVALGFWGFVAPHGIIELPAIFIAGGAGLLLGYALINPGDVPRRVALRQAGGEAIKLVMGVAAMLVVAGVIEGFFSPALIPEPFKFSLAAALGAALAAYLTLAGREVPGARPGEEHTAGGSNQALLGTERRTTSAASAATEESAFRPFPPV